MNEPRTNWQRLYDIAVARLSELGLTRDALNRNGGPSNSWFWALQSRTDRPTPRMARSLEQLDKVLGWPAGTSYSLAKDPFVEGSDTAVDQEQTLIHDFAPPPPPSAVDPHEQRIRDFGTLIMGTLRALPPEQADALMAAILRTADIG